MTHFRGILRVQTPYRLMARDVPTVIDGKMVIYTSTEGGELVRLEADQSLKPTLFGPD